MGRPTLKDVAARVGVSFKTVARVVNGDGAVSEETERRVRQAIAELGYVRDENARTLRSGRSGTIGMVVRAVSDPFFATMCDAVADAAREHGLVVFVGSTQDLPDREREVATAIAGRRPDGMLVTPVRDSQDYLAGFLASGAPVVAVDRPARGVDADAVLTDNVGGTRAAVEHLLGFGHTRIAFLGDDPMVFTAGERATGFREAAAAGGVRVRDDEVVLARPTPELVAATVGRWLDGPDPVTAVVSGNNEITVAVLRALGDRTDRPALVGFDDFDLASLLRPAVSVVAQDPAAIGRAALGLLLDRMGEPGGPSRTIRVPTRLIPRGSGETTLT